MRKLFILILMILLAGCSAAVKEDHKHGKFTQHYKGSIFKVTGNGMFSVEIVIKDHELKTGVNSVDLIIHDQNDGDVTGADISVTPWMPEMGHGVFEKPAIKEMGGGLYTVENIILSMSGRWELRVNIKKGGSEDMALFDFPDVKVDRGHEHEMIKVPVLSSTDLSPARISDNNVFKVLYSSDLEPVPINRIHGWTLTVLTSDGQPVKDAEISIDGDMPEHGHGLPTKPEVSQELGSGKYLVEGMKFSMPGWWRVKFHIRTIDKEDSVTFNLRLKE